MSDGFNLHDVSALTRAPGSDMQILDNPERAIVQLPNDEIKNLIEKEVKVTVLRKFVLFESSKSQTNNQNANVATLQA